MTQLLFFDIGVNNKFSDGNLFDTGNPVSSNVNHITNNGNHSVIIDGVFHSDGHQSLDGKTLSFSCTIRQRT